MTGKSRRLAITFLSVEAAACTQSAHSSGRTDADAAAIDTSVPSRRICDGSSEIRFAYSFGVDSFVYQSSILYDLGTDYLYVNGTCHYWLDKPSTEPDEYKYWRPVREGVLTADEEAALHDAVGYDDFSLAPACVPSEIIDVGVARMWNGERSSRCAGGPQVPPGWPMRDELYAAGSAVDGPMRIKVSEVPVTANDLTYDWPLDVPIANFLVDYDSDESFRIDDTDNVDALARLRETLIVDATQTPGYYRGHIGLRPADDVVAPGQGYALAVRDELPFTDGDGKWNPPQ